MNEQRYSTLGRHTAIAGVQMAIEHLEALLTQLKGELGMLLEGNAPAFNPKHKLEHPKTIYDNAPAVKRSKPAKAITEAVAAEQAYAAKRAKPTPNLESSSLGGRNFWASMTPKQRSKEMRRRHAVAAANKAAAGITPAPPANRIDGQITKGAFAEDLGIGFSTLERRMMELGIKAHVIPRPNGRGRAGVLTAAQEEKMRRSFAKRPVGTQPKRKAEVALTPANAPAYVNGAAVNGGAA